MLCGECIKKLLAQHTTTAATAKNYFSVIARNERKTFTTHSETEQIKCGGIKMNDENFVCR
jgi:hypothetical protein